jgi:toxin ParE1/3/4
LKCVVRTRRASQDIEEAIAYYLSQAKADLAERWLDEFDAACAHITHFPTTGSPKYAKQSAEKGLRFWLLDRFPYSVFYIERIESIEIIRVLHQASDIPQHLKTKAS